MTHSDAAAASADAAGALRADRRFTILRPVSASDLYGTHELVALDSEYVERFWLPLLGPSSFCLLRLFARDMGDARNIFDPIVYQHEHIAAALNLPNQRVKHSLRRLEEYRLLHQDREGLEGLELPVYRLDRFIPMLRPKLWARLPESVRHGRVNE